VIALDSRLDLAEQPADIPKLLPRDSFQYPTSGRGLVRRDRDLNDERIAKDGVRVPVAGFVILFRDVERPEVRFLQRSLERASLDTTLEPELDGFVKTAFCVGDAGPL